MLSIRASGPRVEGDQMHIRRDTAVLTNSESNHNLLLDKETPEMSPLLFTDNVYVVFFPKYFADLRGECQVHSDVIPT